MSLCDQLRAGPEPEWVKNHFALCRRGTVQVVGRDVETGTPVGTLTYVETIIGYAFQGERSVAFDQYFEKIQTTGTIKDSTTFLINRWNQSSATGPILHKGEKHGGVTQISGGFRGEVGAAQEDASIKGWKRESMELLTFDEDKASGTGRDKVHKFDFAPATFFIAAGNKNVQLPEPKITVRFDSASYLKYKQGSIFTDIRATMTYDRGNSDVKETAQHIWDAQHRPGTTIPAKAGKKIPGAPSSTPLHRIFYDTRLRDRNRDTARGLPGAMAQLLQSRQGLRRIPLQHHEGRGLQRQRQLLRTSTDEPRQPEGGLPALHLVQRRPNPGR
ncbi:hypothetical protein OG981_51790 [Streptomyces mirabilis]